MLIKELFAKDQERLTSIKAMLKERPIVLFGAGTLGNKVGQVLLKHNNKLIAFADNDKTKWGKDLLGLKISSAEEIDSFYRKSAVWIISIWSPGHAYLKTKQELQNLGVETIFHSAAVLQIFPDELLPHYHFQTPCYFKKHEAEIVEVYESLVDDESKNQFLSQLDCRINTNFEGLPQPDINNQYFPHGIVSLTANEVFLDAGAFDGDTLEEFSKRTNGQFSKYLALEPDPENFKKLVVRTAKFPEVKVELFPYAVGEENCILNFNATGGEGAGLSDTGSIAVECKKIDDVFFNYKPTFLKFDVEGAELGAIKGAKKTIQRYYPKIAICLYHLPNDLWTIPLLIKEYNSNYKFYVRTHSVDGFEFVLYAISE